eukprot:2316188-Amphidinium_carterae.1
MLNSPLKFLLLRHFKCKKCASVRVRPRVRVVQLLKKLSADVAAEGKTEESHRDMQAANTSL